MNFISSKGRCFTRGELLGSRKSKAVCSPQVRSLVTKPRSLLASRELLFHRVDSEEPHWVTFQTDPTTIPRSYGHTPPSQPSKSSLAKLLMLSVTGKIRTQGTLLSELWGAKKGKCCLQKALSSNMLDFAERSGSLAVTCQAVAGLQLHLLLHLFSSQFLHTCS